MTTVMVAVQCLVLLILVTAIWIQHRVVAMFFLFYLIYVELLKMKSIGIHGYLV